MTPLAILFLVLSASIASAATPSLKAVAPIPASLGEITGKCGYFSPPVALSLENDGYGRAGTRITRSTSSAGSSTP